MEELDLKELFNIFWERKNEIILIVIIFIVIGGLYSFILLGPKYTAYTTVLLAQSSQSDTSGEKITQSDLNLNSSLVSTYSELIKSRAVLREVISNLNLRDVKEDMLKRSISVTSVTGTDIIKIKTTHENANYAALVTNEVARVFKEKVKEIYNISNVYIVDAAEIPESPSNINHAKDLVIFAFIGAIVAAGYALISNMLDTTVKTEQDIEKVTNLLVLSSIPDYDLAIKKGGK